ncbi:hypothetical protein HYS91_05700 [Candidatus Daviesbacteria bacterium]|nr:hypothetical protein [Candidatus Daviesbacteria bacterium]
MDKTQLKCDISGSYYEPNSFSDRVHRYVASETDEELIQNLNGVVEPLEDFISWFEGLLWELEMHSKDKIKINPSNFSVEDETPEYQLLYNMWNVIGLFLLQKLPQQSTLTLKLQQSFLQVVRNIQKPKKGNLWIRKNKGGIYHHIGLSLLYLGESDKAKSYFALATIEDLMNQQDINSDDFKKAPAYQAMKQLQVFSDESESLAALKQMITDRRANQKYLELSNTELIFLEFLSLGSRKMRVLQFLLWDNLFFNTLIREIKSKNIAKDAGKYLEFLSAYLFSISGRFEVFINSISLHAEHDLKIRNLIKDDPILELLGRYLLVECKNWENKPDSSILKKFISNVRFARCDTGILITKKEITGTMRRDSAWYVIRAEYHKDNVIIIVITLNDLEQIAQEKISFLELLKKKYEQIRFDENC